MRNEFLRYVDEITEFRHTLSSETDRGCALMAAAYLDEQLAGLLRSVFIDGAVSRDLLSQNGPLATFSSRIDMCFSLGLIDREVHRDLHLIRRTRNDFAHTSRPLHFSDAALADRCRELHHNYRDKESPPRTIFLGVAMVVTSAVFHAMSRANPPVEPDAQEISADHRNTFAKLLELLHSVDLSVSRELLQELKSWVAEQADKSDGESDSE